MSTKKRYTRYTITEKHGAKVKLEFDTGFECSEQRQTKHGPAITIYYAGRRIALKAREKGAYEAEGSHTQTGKRRPRTAPTLEGAIEWAVDELHQVVRGNSSDPETLQTAAVSGGERNLAQARALCYERNVWQNCKSGHQAKYKAVLDMAMVLFGPEKPVSSPWSQSDINRWFAARCGTTINGRDLTERELRDLGITELGIRFPKAYGRPDRKKKVLPISAKIELIDLIVCLNYLVKESVDGQRFITINPISGLDLGNAVRGERAEYHIDRFEWLFSAADHSDTTGQLRLILVLAFLTGHRIGAILGLEVDHLAFTTRQVRRLIDFHHKTHEKEPTPSRWWADHFPHGAIWWVPSMDKEGYSRVVPISAFIRAEIDRYLHKRTRMLEGRESRWVFPDLKDESRALEQTESVARLRKAEQIARPAIAAAGLDQDDIMQATPGDAWHPCRGWWEVRHSELLWTGDPHSAYAGGWTCNTGNIQATVYGELHPALIQACVDGRDRAEASRELGLIDRAQRAMTPEIRPIAMEPMELAA